MLLIDKLSTIVRLEGRTFPTLVGCRLQLFACQWRRFYFAGILRPATEDWPEAYAILRLIVASNTEIAQSRATRTATVARAPSRLPFSRPGATTIRQRGGRTLRHGERRSIQRLRAKLIEAGVLHQNPPATHPIDDVTGQFATELRRRGLLCQQFRLISDTAGNFYARYGSTGGITHLQYDDIRDYLASNSNATHPRRAN